MRKAPIAAAGVLLLAATPFASATDTQRAFIDSEVTVPTGVSTLIGTALPESREIGTSFLSGTYDPNITLSAASNVFVTFMTEGAGYKNSLGYFTYTTDGQTTHIVDRQLIFPNASFADPNKGWGGGELNTGDTVTLRDGNGNVRAFQSGEHIGFFLVQNAWNGSSVRGWSATNPTIPAETAAENAAAGVFTTLDDLNPEVSTGHPELARHVAMINFEGVPGFVGGNNFLITGFEDQRRDLGSDNDFNDVVVMIQSNPISAVQSGLDVPVYTTSNPDPDGDGVSGLADYFPFDPERAFVTRTPATGWDTVAFEDRYPDVGDADYNDFVADLATEEVLRADGALVDLSATIHLSARGSTLDHEMGIAVPGLPSERLGHDQVRAVHARGRGIRRPADDARGKAHPHQRHDDASPPGVEEHQGSAPRKRWPLREHDASERSHAARVGALHHHVRSTHPARAARCSAVRPVPRGRPRRRALGHSPPR